MKRRRLLALAGATALAGCMGGDSETNADESETPIITTHSGPANFANVSISGPTSVDVGEEFELTISAANTGGDTGDFTTTLTIGEGVFGVDRSVVIEEVQPGEVGETTFGPWTMTRASEYVARITDHGAQHTITGDTRVAKPKERVTFGDVAVMLEDLWSAARIKDEDGIHRPSNDTFLIAEMQLSGEETIYSNAFTLNGAEPITTHGRLREQGGNTFASDEGGGLLVWDMQASEVGGDVSVALTLSGTIPEVQFDAADVSVPSLDVEATIPDEVELGSEIPVVISVENTGEGDGTYRGTVEREVDWEWEMVRAFERTVPAGESVELEASISADTIGSATLRVAPDVEEHEVAINPITKSFGEIANLPSGVGYGVDIDDTLYSSYEYVSGNETGTYEAGDGEQILFIKHTMDTPNEEISTPANYNWVPVYDGEELIRALPYFTEVHEFASPDYGELFFFDETVPANVGTFSKWSAWEIPEDADIDDVSVQLSMDAEIHAIWQ